jgi:hypothetical protein
VAFSPTTFEISSPTASQPDESQLKNPPGVTHPKSTSTEELRRHPTTQRARLSAAKSRHRHRPMKLPHHKTSTAPRSSTTSIRAAEESSHRHPHKLSTRNSTFINNSLFIQRPEPHAFSPKHHTQLSLHQQQPLHSKTRASRILAQTSHTTQPSSTTASSFKDPSLTHSGSNISHNLTFINNGAFNFKFTHHSPTASSLITHHFDEPPTAHNIKFTHNSPTASSFITHHFDKPPTASSFITHHFDKPPTTHNLKFTHSSPTASSFITHHFDKPPTAHNSKFTHNSPTASSFNTLK